MSSTILIGFVDRTSVCIRAEFTPPIADDERRERLIHAALLTGRAFASLTPDRQRAFSGVLREWEAAEFETCPLQVVDGDPMACPHRFVATFLAPVREYAIAMSGCGKAAGGIEYFLPMAAAAYLRQLADTDHDPAELLKPALALCAAAMIHPLTVENHFSMAAASLPKVEPILDRTLLQPDLPSLVHPPDVSPPVADAEGGDSAPRRSGTRRALFVALSVALIVTGVQYFSMRDTGPAEEPVSVRSASVPPVPPAPMTSPPDPPPASAVVAPPPRVVQLLRSVPAPKPLSPQTRAYVRKVRDLAENSLAQVAVMVAAAERIGTANDELIETLEYGVRQLQTWRRQAAALAPPATLTKQHQEIGRMMLEMGRMAQAITHQSSHASRADVGAIRDRLAVLHAQLARVLNEAEGF